MDQSILTALGQEFTQLLKTYREMRPLSLMELKNAALNLDQDFMPVIVPEGWINGLGHVRALGRNGIMSVVADPNPKALTFYSKFALPYQCPKFFSLTEDIDEDIFFNDLYQLGETIQETGKQPVLFITAAEKINPMAVKRLKELRKRFLLTSDISVQYQLEDKKLQLEIAKSAGIDVPQTFYVENREDFVRLLPDLRYPILIKARKGKEFHLRFHVQVFRVTNEEECYSAYERASDFSLIFQEEIPGSERDLFTLGSYLDSNSKPLGLFTGHKIRSNHKYGTCAMGISCEEPEVVEKGIAFLQLAKYHGASQIELKRDERNGKLYFIEINNRLWKWHSLTEACGVSLPYIQFLDAIGQPPEELPAQTNGIRWWLPFMDVWTAFREVQSGETTMEDYLNEIDLDYVDGVGSWDDPLPALVNFFNFGWMR